MCEGNADSQIEIIRLAGNPVDLTFSKDSVIVSFFNPDFVKEASSAEKVNIAITILLSKRLLIK